jgi:hypothetical protein
VVNAVYPNGVMNPSVADVDVTIIQGWPIKNKLDDVLKAGKAMVSIFPTNKEKPITVFERIYKTVLISDSTVLVDIEGLNITFSGSVSVPLSIIATVNNIPYQYTVLDSDTLYLIATNLSALIPGSSSTGATIMLSNNTYSVLISFATQASAALELGRQEREFMISIWSPNPVIRPLLGSAIDNYMRENYQFPIDPDNFNIMIFYSHTDETDGLQIPLIYRRDLFFKIQYSTTKIDYFTTIAKTISNLTVITGGAST